MWSCQGHFRSYLTNSTKVNSLEVVKFGSMDEVELHGDILQPGGQLDTPGLVIFKKGQTFYETRPGVSSCPPGCKISPCNSTLSIEPNFTTSNELTLVEFVKYDLKWPGHDPKLVHSCYLTLLFCCQSFIC